MGMATDWVTRLCGCLVPALGMVPIGINSWEELVSLFLFFFHLSVDLNSGRTPYVRLLVHLFCQTIVNDSSVRQNFPIRVVDR